MKDFLLDLKVFLNCAFESGFLKDHSIGASHNKNYWFSDYYLARDYFDSVPNEKVNIKLPMFNIDWWFLFAN